VPQLSTRPLGSTLKVLYCAIKKESFMQLINRLIKGIVGAIIVAVTLVVLFVPLDIGLLGINPREDIGVLINWSVFIIGIIVGGLWFPKVKWWKIVVLILVSLIMMLIVWKKYPGFGADGLKHLDFKSKNPTEIIR
jgi:hypothetical protein